MSDVFISYGHATAALQARGAAQALRALGYSVWIDDDLPAHRAFTPEIEAQLTAAKATLVIWSAEAAASHWVLSEANRAREANKLVQLRIDGARLPMPFDQIQCADLSGWSGEGEHPAWPKVAASVADLVRDGGAQRPALPSAAHADAAPVQPLLAVLAFDNLSGDPEMTYFSDGVSEEILQTVARGADLKVIGRTSSFQLRGADKAIRKVVADLNATHVLDGSVRRSGSKVRIAANLIECGRQTTLWSNSYDRDLTDVFALWDEIAASVAAALRTTLARSPPPSPIEPDVYDRFLRAQAHPVIGLEATNEQLKMLEEVVNRAPRFARGWATLAFRGARALWAFGPAAAVTRDQTTEAAQMALRLDPHAGLAYQALGFLEPFAAYHAREALSDKAFSAAPNDPLVLSMAGHFYGIVGRTQDGLSFTRRAHDLDPLAPEVMNRFAIALIGERRYDEAGELLDAALARWPGSDAFVGPAISIAVRQGDRGKVESLIKSWSATAAGNERLPTPGWFARNLLDPDLASINDYLEKLRAELVRTGTIPLLELLRVYRLGLRDEAFELIDRASFAFMFEPIGLVPWGPHFPGVVFGYAGDDFVRDPRFLRLCAKLGLCDYWIETGKWPDCAGEVPYDFRTEARRQADAQRSKA
jgi:TolB-like protein/tetratricopeptide (TPR) repeat protein